MPLSGYSTGSVSQRPANASCLRVPCSSPCGSVSIILGEQVPFFKFEAGDFPVAVLRGGKGLPKGG